MNNKHKLNPGNLPRKKVTAKRKRGQTSDKFLNSFQVPLSNKFNVLDEENDDIADRSLPPSKIKLSPIIVTDHVTDIKAITDSLNIKCEVKLMSIGRKLFVNSIEEKNKICEALKSKEINYFSHPDKSSKIFKAVLTGLPEVDTNEICDCLKTTLEIELPKVTMFKTKSPNKLYLCEFVDCDIDMKKLNEVKSVYHHIIKWASYKPKRKGPTQCHRCLMYGHGISMCNRFAACLQCGGNHLTKDCTVITKDTTNPAFKCFNCASANLDHAHKANDPACPFRAKYVKSKTNTRNNSNSQPTQNKQNTNTNARFIPAPAPKPLTLSFTDAMAQANTQQNARTNTPAPSSVFVSNSYNNATTPSTSNNNELWSFAEVASILFNSINQLKQCKTKLDQLMVITSMLQNACN